MKQFTMWPPPNWTECVITWEWLLGNRSCHPTKLYDWCEEHLSEGRFHVHGWQSTEGFAFRFENPRDATLFKLTWSQ
jgi:hypothetical protein